MPMKYVEPAVAAVVQTPEPREADTPLWVVIYHTYKNGDWDDRLMYWFDVSTDEEGPYIDIRMWPGYESGRDPISNVINAVTAGDLTQQGANWTS